MIFNRYLVVGDSNFSPGDEVPADWDESTIKQFVERGDIKDKEKEQEMLLESIDPETQFLSSVEDLDPEGDGNSTFLDELDDESEEQEETEQEEDEADDDEESIAPSRQNKRRSRKK